MAHGRDGALHDKNVGPGFLRDLAKALRALRNRADRRRHARVLDLPDAGRNQIFLDGFRVDFLQKRGHVRFVRLDDFLQHFLRVFVATLHPLEIEHGESAELTHLDRKTDIDHSIHGAGQDRDLEFKRFLVAARETPGDVDFVRVDRDATGDERNLVEPVAHARFAIPANPHSHD